MSNITAVVRSTVEFYETSRYNQLFPGIQSTDWLFNLFAHPRVPFFSVLAYLILSKSVFSFIRTTLNIQPKGGALQWTTIIHSTILAVYSLWTFTNTASIVFPLFFTKGFYGTLCDVSGEVWFEHGLGFWVTHFYLSKYYEFIDTWIILLKGREPMFLQTYHHAGIVILMWGFIATADTAGGLIVTLFNSLIHTLMYTYYTLAAFGYSSPLKHYLTQAQIIQFVIGISLTFPTHFIDQCVTPAQSAATLAIQLYAVVLIYLFYDFYRKSYTSKKGKGEELNSSNRNTSLKKLN